MAVAIGGVPRWLALASLGALVSCGASDKMNGFTEREALARAAEPGALEACQLRKGRLVMEVERALVREYPHTRRDYIQEKKQPLLLLWVSYPSGGPGAVALTPLPAPEEYTAGALIRWFEGKRLLDQPVRMLRGRRLDLRLAENNRSFEPAWRKLASQLGHGVTSTAGAVGAPAPSPGLVDLALEQLNQLDRDDLILRWSIDIDTVVAALGEPHQKKALRYRLLTSRAAPVDPTLPAAEVDALFFWEPEPGCEWPYLELPRPPPAATGVPASSR